MGIYSAPEEPIPTGCSPRRRQFGKSCNDADISALQRAPCAYPQDPGHRRLSRHHGNPVMHSDWCFVTVLALL